MMVRKGSDPWNWEVGGCRAGTPRSTLEGIETSSGAQKASRRSVARSSIERVNLVDHQRWESTMYRARPWMTSIFRISGSQSRPSLDTARHLGAIGGDPYCGDWQRLALEHPSGFRTGQMHSDPASGATIADPRRQHMCSRCSRRDAVRSVPRQRARSARKAAPIGRTEAGS
jgi:hypothetical protein